MRIALVHDWLLGHRGGEKVLDALARLCPNAEVFTLFADRAGLTPALRRLKLHTSWLDALPASHRYYRQLLPFMPGAIERFDLRGFDLVISSSHCVAKGVRVPRGVPHLCYCHSPMRYAWHLRDLYLERVPSLVRPLARRVLDRLRRWDRRTTDRVNLFIANGQTVRGRIRDAYGRDSVVLHPPVATDFYVPAAGTPREEFYLVVSALVPNKRVDLAVVACRELDRRLVVIGCGPEEHALRRAAGPSTKFRGWRSDAEVRDHFQRCRALLFPGEEDFGMVPIEANACGTPVLAYGRGGATETILPPEQSDSPTGLWFPEPTVQSLMKTMRQFESLSTLIRPNDCRRQAERFDAEHFHNGMRRIMDHYLSRSGVNPT